MQLAEKQAELIQLQLAAEQLTPDMAQATLDKVSDALDAAAATADRLPGLTAEIRRTGRATDRSCRQSCRPARVEMRLSARSSSSS